ncbi:tubulin polyglutamylase TTLL13 isoform X2 [Drosophila kikkawai]|uniref:Tubulin polyglutamylase TTLL13 isoform X2 n=1 Tax=Drosophila kikkawai TaxID=30033 RepID=A0A6P4JBM2_DROKI|nr:tubulin polyglutamylase TTLL13 isoform X2 [Drosophila kikkawai]
MLVCLILLTRPYILLSKFNVPFHNRIFYMPKYKKSLICYHRNPHQIPHRMSLKVAKHTCYYEAQKSMPRDKSEALGRESVYVLANKPCCKRRYPPIWRCRGGSAKDDRFMVITEDPKGQPPNKPSFTPSELDAICYDATKGPPMQFHVDGTDIMPSIRGLRLSVCVENTRFQLIGKVTRNMGFQHVPQHRLWNIQWSDCTPHHELLRSMKRFQQINHFPGMVEICRKDLLSRNLNRMLKLFPGDYRIFPRTWLMPTDAYDVAIYASKHKRSFILKPYSAGQGRGIWITTDLRTVTKREKLICQTYIERPLLIDGYKFDLRVYTLVTSVDPLRIFVYNEGLARFATQKYVTPSLGNAHNVFMHLTNYCLNRRNSQYMVGNSPEVGSKRKLSAFNKWLVEHNYDVAEFWASVDDAIIKTIISAWPVLKHNYNMCFPKHDKIQASFQLLGFDILVDWKLKPYILEVNHTPSLSTDETVDMEVKRPLIRDTLNMLSTALVDKEQIIREDRIEHRTRLLRNLYNKKSAAQMAGPSQAGRETGGGTDLRQTYSIGSLTQQIAWEESHLGNYRRIMPPRESEKVQYYCKFYDQNKASMFAGTLSSRKREAHNHKAMQKQCQDRQQEQIVMQKRVSNPLRWPSDRKSDPMIQHAKRRREVEEARAKKHRAVIAREIQSQKEQLLAPIFAKTELGERQKKPREKHRKNAPKRSSSIHKHHRRKVQRHLNHRVRHQRMLELEAQQDAKFLEEHARNQRLEAGQPSELPKSKSFVSLRSRISTKSKQSLKSCKSKLSSKSFKSKQSQQSCSFKKRRPGKSSSSLQTSSKWESIPSHPQLSQPSANWTADDISDVERAEHLSWRKDRTEQFNDTQLRALIFSKMYECGHLTKNDIKCFPDLLYNILSSNYNAAV